MKQSPEFLYAKGLSINNRLALIAALALTGIMLQTFVSMLGWFLVLSAAVLGIIRSKSNEPQIIGSTEWKSVTPEELKAANNLILSGDKISKSTGDLSVESTLGAFWGVVALVSTIVIAVILYNAADSFSSRGSYFDPVVRGGSVALIFAVDTVTLLAPLWFSGGVRPWEPRKLRVRLNQLMPIYEEFSKNSKLEFMPSLQVTKAVDGNVPLDAKIMVKIKDTDADFMGIQLQTSFNSVQGQEFPYTYCVLIAKPSFGLAQKVESRLVTPGDEGFMGGLKSLFTDANAKREAAFARFENAIVELKHEGDVDIAVVRQDTTPARGYTTTPYDARAVFGTAIDLANFILSH